MKRKQKQKWDSVCLHHMGLQTDLQFIHLVEEAKSLMLFQQKHQRPAERKHESMALVAVLIETMDYPDKKLPLQLLEGLPIYGDIDYDSGVYRPNPSEENAGVFNIHFEEWKKSHDACFIECSTQLSRSAEKAKGEALRGDRTRLDTLHKIDRATKLEVQKGLMGPSLSEQELRAKYESNGALTCRIIPPFAVFQGATDKR